MIQLPAPIPLQILDLPRDDRGYPVPAENEWLDSGPLLANQDWRRFATLLAFERCAICGCKFAETEPLYRLFAQEDGEATEAADRCVRSDGPAHYACMVFSAMICPFFASPGARRKSGHAARGRRAAIMGFRKVLVQAEFNSVGGINTVDFHYQGLLHTEWFDTSSRLTDQLVDAVARQQPIAVEDRMYWRSHNDLLPDFKEARKVLRRAWMAQHGHSNSPLGGLATER